MKESAIPQRPADDGPGPGASKGESRSPLVTSDLTGDASPTEDAPTEIESSGEGARVLGRVQDENGEPVQRFLVISGPTDGRGEDRYMDTIQGEGGSFELSDLGPGDWAIGVATQAGGSFDLKTLELRAGEEVELEFMLPHPSPVRGIVLDPSGAPIEARVFGQVATPAIPYDNADWGEIARAHADGTFSLSLTPGSVYLYAVADGYAASPVVRFALEPGEAKDGVELRLEDGGTADVTVLDAYGNPAEGFPVRVSDREYRFDRTVETDAAGHARFDGLQPDTFSASITVWVERNGGGFTSRLASGQFELGTGGHGELTLHLPKSREIDLTVHVLVPAFLEGAPGSIWAEEVEGSRSAHLKLGRDGSFHGELPGPGLFDVKLFLYDSGFRWSGRIRVPDAPSHEVTLEIDVGQVSGKVVDASGMPVSGVDIDAVSLGTTGPRMHNSTETDRDGRYTLCLQPATYHMEAELGEGSSLAPATLDGIVVDAGADVRGIDFLLSEGGKVRGRVLLTDGSPPLDVFLFFEGEGATLGARVDAAGEFLSPAIPPGRCAIVASSKAGNLALAEPALVEILPGEETEVELVLVPGGEVTAAVFDGGEKTLEAAVEIRGPLEVKGFPSDYDELYHWQPLPYGDYRAVATLGTRRGETAFTLDASHPSPTIEITLE
ncbi:MAG TPA: carboxypeptidase regulatory-like domain-containing protein [Planctomycetes bacterium]|nr:carboxypeptidase regulatory-like domain-containing protein [Planctomycetota bacterium]